MTSPTPNEPKKSGGFRGTMSSLFRSPANDKYNKVLAGALDKAKQPGDPSTSSDGKAANLSDKEKAKALVEQRDAASPSGSFVLGTYKPLSASQGYGEYYVAKEATGR